MLKKWLNKVLPGKAKTAKLSRQVLSFNEHGIHAESISFAAEKVIKRLKQSGFEAYIVGGAVRDLLLGVEPKDFDVATDAPPEAVRKLFRRSRIVGRRFPIVHVMVGPETIEVTTFRGGPVHTQNELGRIMRDVSFGSQEQDAQRRDFTANALYYDPIDQVVVDFHHGVDDIRLKKLVMIGEPAARYQEDPVRMLRAARLSGKLGFSVEGATASDIIPCADLLRREPPARLFDEILKILFSGHAQNCLQQIHALGLSGHVHPLLDALATGADKTATNMASLALKNTDERLRADKSVSMGFVLAAVLWPQVLALWLRYQAQGMRPAAALNAAIADVRAQMDQSWGVPQRYGITMREIWVLQPQFEARKGTRPFRLLSQARFRAAYDFLSLRAQLGEVPMALVQWWHDFQAADHEGQQQLIQNAPAESGVPQNRKRRRKPRNKAKAAEISQDAD
ncbi:polynucleotide adenylyltransferase PcnB [Snodgrassella sp. CFCC 13594]|uniref:polynucleotide adenylyltransferase PcnB n=1 Tax=Snodgrassella sp. CFCC 13594 TaxID=1775559 RepID=UPI00082F6293|nr:polynucleotide adenylyltransferase PcnB [Snodgrassella sp. CFCC 13594]